MCDDRQPSVREGARETYVTNVTDRDMATSTGTLQSVIYAIADLRIGLIEAPAYRTVLIGTGTGISI